MIRVVKKFDIISEEVSEMLNDVNAGETEKITIVYDGNEKTATSAIIELHNGFLKVIESNEVTLIRYMNVSGYSIIKKEKTINRAEETSIIASSYDITHGDIITALERLETTLNPAFLNKTIPEDVKRDIILDWYMDYEGYGWDDIKNDDWELERFNNMLNNNKTYKDLNSEFESYYIHFWLDEYLLNDWIVEAEGDLNKILNKHNWIKNIIVEYKYLMKDDANLIGGSIE